jgi:hypothetical protein
MVFSLFKEVTKQNDEGFFYPGVVLKGFGEFLPENMNSERLI